MYSAMLSRVHEHINANIIRPLAEYEAIAIITVPWYISRHVLAYPSVPIDTKGTSGCRTGNTHVPTAVKSGHVDLLYLHEISTI